MAKSATALPSGKPGMFTILLRGVQKLHLLAALLPLAFLAKMLLVTSSTGFTPNRTAYDTVAWEGESQATYLVDTWRRPRGKILAVWGLKDYHLDQALDENHPIVELLNHVNQRGVQLRICSPLADSLKAFLPSSAQYFDDPLTAAAGVHGVLQMNTRPPFENIDLVAVAKNMPGYLFFDMTHNLHPPDVDAAGLQYLGLGPTQGPPWLDPDLMVYSDFLLQKTDPDDGLLLLPTTPPGTISGRARWFLHLNYRLYPRRLYIYEPFDASGTSVQFRQWVLNYKKEQRWGGRSRWEPKPRELSKILGVGAARSLVQDEIQAIRDLDVDWVTFFSMGSDFRLQDWETVPATDAIEHSR